MRIKIISECTAEVTLSPKEATLVRSGRVPAIYSPGGMSFHDLPDSGGRALFGGACFVNPERTLNLALDALHAALTHGSAHSK